MKPYKLTFEEVIKTSVVFYVDESLEKRFDEFVRKKAQSIIKAKRPGKTISVDELIKFLRTEPDALTRVLSILHLSKEKFLRIISLLRKIEGTFDVEWNFNKVNRKIKEDIDFARKIADLFINGKNNPILVKYLPLYYRERLNLTTLEEFKNENELILKLKDRYMGQYHKWKGDAVEELIRKRLETLGVSYAKGKTEIIDVTVDWAIPNLQNPQIIIMSSYQETTSSAQSEKARGMLRCYELIQHRNMQRGERRIFINFVDGGGWLARQADLRRLVDACHYFLNINTLSMLDNIIKYHFPNLLRQSS
jgi:hypothetical protein